MEERARLCGGAEAELPAADQRAAEWLEHKRRAVALTYKSSLVRVRSQGSASYGCAGAC